jgi:hypothetical protein
MRASAPAGLLTMIVFACALPAAGLEPGAPAAERGQAQPPLRARLTDDVIRQAVRETLAERPSGAADTGRVLSAERNTSFARQVDEARRPSCWQPDAMKHQPPQLGPITLGGILAVPFWAASIVRGKCSP